MVDTSILRKGGQYVYEKARSGFQSVSETPGAWKVILTIGGVGVAGFAAYELIKTYSGPSGGSCATAGTPCYTAVSPYESEFQACFSQWQTLSSQFLQENAANGTGFTSAQLSELSYYESCMNTAASNIAKTANQYVPTNPLGVLSNYMGSAILAAGVGVGIAVPVYYGLKAYLASRVTAAQATNIGMNALLKNAVNNNEIPADSAGPMADSVSSIGSEQVAANNSVITQTYVAEDLTTSAEAAAVASDTNAAMAADTDEVVALLESIA